MNWISRFIGGRGEGDALEPGIAEALAHWQALPDVDLSRAHFEARYVVVNTEATGLDLDRDRLLAVGAIAIDGGLITPVIRNAHTKSLSAISAEMKDFAARARARKLKPDEYQGGTTAVSNLGMYGIKDFTAVINPPHATILAVGTGEQRAIVRDGKVEVANMMSVTMSCDNRAVDGALGAELLGAFRQLIENPMTMMV